MADVSVSDHGTVVILTPVTPEAVEWFADHVEADAPRWGAGYACDHRPARDILEGLAADGLTFA